MKRLGISVALVAAGLCMAAPAVASTLEARVDLASQTMEVIQYGRVIHTWKVSTARNGYVTPPGSWRPKRMHEMWYSRKYDMAPMPFAVFYNGGYAIHGTDAVSRLGRPASHGCVRLDTPNARIFYQMVRDVGPGNTRVTIN